MSTCRLLVTGGCGFIGSNFINYWLQKYPNATLVNIDRLDPCASLQNITEKSTNYTLVVADVANTQLVLNILRQFEITHIVHFAAQTHVDHSFGNSLSFTQSNIVGTHSLLEAARIYGKLERFLHMSTDEVYGEIHEGSFIEGSLLNPTNPYAATKAGAEFLVKSYGFSFKLPYSILRGNNVYGPNQYPEKVIPAFTMALLKNEQMKIQGKGDALRMFIHIQDVVEGVESVLLKGETTQTYNIGCQEQYSVMEVAKKIFHLVNPKKTFEESIQFVEDRLFNDCRYSVDTKKIELLGWKCKRSFEEGLASTVRWYEENKDQFFSR
jgi:dTDP-glucose 4,6-dehydratase